MIFRDVKRGLELHYRHRLWGCVKVKVVRIHHATNRVDVEENAGHRIIEYREIKPSFLHRPEDCKPPRQKKRCENVK